jgi:hypothetical protein
MIRNYNGKLGLKNEVQDPQLGIKLAQAYKEEQAI